MIKKWYFCLSESSIDRANHGWRDLIAVAVNSALANTNFEPYLIYDGVDSHFLDFLRAKGVNIIFHRVGFYDALAKRDESEPGYLAIASGAFLRTEIPLIEKEDEFVLYTDCDVIFRGQPNFSGIRPELFACAPQAAMADYDNDANSGVLVINVPKMRESYKEFSDFIVRNLNAGWPGCDQENYRRFYHGKWDRLPLGMNWKPYWGVGDDATIVHWHGPKPEAIQRKVDDESFNLYEAWDKLYNWNKVAYKKYVDEWSSYKEDYLPDYVRGHIDVVSGSSVGGWALYGPDSNYPLQIGLKVDGGDIFPVDTSGRRGDLEKVFKAIRGGFNFDLKKLPSNSTVEIVDHLGCRVGLKHDGNIISKFYWDGVSMSKFE
ncbi:hypothetical protein [Burkholderia sp. WTPI3]|uniref:hypothetical protein n=1 Tax=Burkholderia sp. WTPI3 TaxID=2822167 RepID=UPI001F2F6C29|nr:hypothetical protein [Burkholderia sp. WTPI3]